MSKNCNNCGTEKTETMQNVTVPYAVVELAEARQKWLFKRMWIAIIVLICLLFGSFGLFVWYESQFVTVSYEQDGDGLNNVNVGEQGDINNGAESEDKVQEEQ